MTGVPGMPAAGPRAIRLRAATLAFVLAVAAVLGGCRREEPAGAPQPREKIAVATQSPLRGPLRPLGEQIVNGAQMAVEENRERFQALGFELELLPFDDADPGQGIANAELILAEPRILGVVGHLNSETAIPASEKYHQGGLALVSPASSAVELTERNLPNVNRLVARDDDQGRAAAAFAADKLKARSVFIVHDRTAYGQGLADEFKAAVERRGVRIAGYRGISRGQGLAADIVQEMRRRQPDLIYFAGMPGDGGRLLKTLRDGGYRGAFMGGDALGTRETVRVAGAAAAGAYFTAVVPPLHLSETGRRWAARYRARYGDAPEAYAAAAYDAANVLLRAVESAIRANGSKRPPRDAVSRAVRRMEEYKGVTGSIAFDAKGDNRFAGPDAVRIYYFRPGGARGS